MADILQQVAQDPNVSSDYRRQFDRIVHPQSNLLVRRAHVQADRRFTGESVTGFGNLDFTPSPMNEDDESADYSTWGDRAARMAEYDRELRDDCRAIDEDDQ